MKLLAAALLLFPLPGFSQMVELPMPTGGESLAAARAELVEAPIKDSGALFDLQAGGLPQVPDLSELPSLSAAPEPPSNPPTRRPSRLRVMAPHLVTTLNLASGVTSILAASNGQFGAAAALIALGNFFDMMDGRVARALHVEGRLGVELDSQADVVTFGAAPAVLIHRVALHSLGPAGMAIAVAYAAAGAYRLARFNLMALELRPKPAMPADSFLGMPIPAGAGIVAGTAIALGAVSPWASAVITLGAATAMASTFAYPAFKKGGLKKLAVPAAVALAAAGATAAFGLARWAPLAVFGLYLLSGPARRILRR